MESKLDEKKESAKLAELRRDVMTAEKAFQEKQGGILKFLEKISAGTEDTLVQTRIKDLTNHIEYGLSLPPIVWSLPQI